MFCVTLYSFICLFLTVNQIIYNESCTFLRLMRVRNARSKQFGEYYIITSLFQSVHRAAWNVWSTDRQSATSESVEPECGTTPAPRHANVTTATLLSFCEIILLVCLQNFMTITAVM